MHITNAMSLNLVFFPYLLLCIDVSRHKVFQIKAISLQMNLGKYEWNYKKLKKDRELNIMKELWIGHAAKS